jgi:anaerobic ribonucleoside-triphosphate reductase activating protein
MNAATDSAGFSGDKTSGSAKSEAEIARNDARREAASLSLAELQLRLNGTADDSIVDGPGIRLALFTQGCGRACPGCHNPDSQPYTGGYTASDDELFAMVEANPLLSGITLSGGEPFDQASALLPFVRRLRAERPTLTVWAYSGYLYEELLADIPSSEARELLELCDVLVDGPYVEQQRSLDLKWCGSSNQRVIDVQEALSSGLLKILS